MTGDHLLALLDDVRVAVAASVVEFPGLELLPQRLARACAAVLPVDGAGISMFFASDRRLPLGASDEVSADAERLQFTVGEGPCLSADAHGRVLVSDESDLLARWPAFYAELVAHTPVRGVISLPLEDDLRGFGALDLYAVPPRDVSAVTLSDAMTVTAEVTAVFQAANARGAGDADGPAWLDAPSAERRSLVWQAIGFLNASLRISSPDALALVRAHAHSRGADVDDVARAVLNREVPLEDLALGFVPPAV